MITMAVEGLLLPRMALLRLMLSMAMVSVRGDVCNVPKGSMSWCSTYLGLKGVPVSLLWSLGMYYIQIFGPFGVSVIVLMSSQRRNI